MTANRAPNPISFERPEVAEAFAAIPPAPRERLLQLRALILDTAAKTPGVGQLEEALRWGEPSYLTTASKSGTTIRIHWNAQAARALRDVRALPNQSGCAIPCTPR